MSAAPASPSSLDNEPAARSSQPAEAVPALRARPFLVGLSLVTGCTLTLEVLDTRLLSVLTWYSLAFFVIAMGLCGLTAGAVHVYFRSEAYTGGRLPSALSRAALGLAVAVPLSYVLLLIIPLRAEPVATTVLLFLFFSVALALPFYPAGVVVAAALTRSPFPIGRIYAVDLLGAALGAPLVPLLLQLTDAGTAILLVGALAAVAALAFAMAGSDTSSSRRARIALIALLALAGVNGLSDRGLKPLWVKERPESHDHVDLELWNSHSRVQVFRVGEVPAMFWGLGAKCQPPNVTQRMLVIDGHAATPLYHASDGLEQLRFIDCDVTNVANMLRPGGAAAIIGVGGGRDIQAAVLAGRSPVVGIEFNARLLQILKSPLGAATGLQQHPAVRLVHDEARSYLTRSDAKYRLVQASLIDTWAATGAGAHALGENGLYTLEAWRLFLERLEPEGLFTVSRWSTVETARMVALAVAALLEIGVERPRDHIALLGAGQVTTLLVGRAPLSEDDSTRLLQIAEEKGFVPMVLPGERPSAERLNAVLGATNREELDRASLLPLLDLRPPTDDRPFFFNVLRLRSFWTERPSVTEGTIQGNLLATRTLALAFFASIVLAAATIVVPLGRRARTRGRPSPVLLAGFAYFLLIGVGFMLAEIALLQRLSLVLGHPSYSLIVVLSSLVAAAGAGSLLSDRLPLHRAPYCYTYPPAIAALLTLVAVAWPSVTPLIAPAATGVRVAFAVAVTSGLGLLLGMAFPAGMRLVRGMHDAETPWLWGLNGVGSVLASSAAILIALELGLTVLLLVATGCYLLLLVPIAVFRHGRAHDTGSV